MNSQTLTNVIAVSNLVIATTAVIAALLAPGIAARLNANSELKRSKTPGKNMDIRSVDAKPSYQ